MLPRIRNSVDLLDTETDAETVIVDGMHDWYVPSEQDIHGPAALHSRQQLERSVGEEPSGVQSVAVPDGSFADMDEKVPIAHSEIMPVARSEIISVARSEIMPIARSEIMSISSSEGMSVSSSEDMSVSSSEGMSVSSSEKTPISPSENMSILIEPTIIDKGDEPDRHVAELVRQIFDECMSGHFNRMASFRAIVVGYHEVQERLVHMLHESQVRVDGLEERVEQLREEMQTIRQETGAGEDIVRPTSIGIDVSRAVGLMQEIVKTGMTYQQHLMGRMCDEMNRIIDPTADWADNFDPLNWE